MTVRQEAVGKKSFRMKFMGVCARKPQPESLDRSKY
jgi:hypothetical protein